MTKEKADYFWDIIKNCKEFASVLAYELDMEYTEIVHGEETIKEFLNDWAESFRKQKEK